MARRLATGATRKDGDSLIDRRLKIRHVQCFVEIVRKRSLKLAADSLLLTQPAVSKTLKELEEIVGATLLSRDRGGVELTPQGDMFLEFAEMGMAALQRGIDGLRLDGSGASRRVAVGALPSVAARLMPAASRAFAALQPDATLVIADGSHGHLIERLRLGELDVVIGRLGEPQTMQGLSFTQLYMEHVEFVLRPDHPWLAKPDLARLADWPVIFPSAGSAIRPLVERFLIAHGIGALRYPIETVSGAFGRVAVAQSDAVWIISGGVVADDLARGRLARLPLDTSLMAGPVGIMLRSDDSIRPEVRALVRAVETAARELEAQGALAVPRHAGQLRD